MSNGPFSAPVPRPATERQSRVSRATAHTEYRLLPMAPPGGSTGIPRAAPLCVCSAVLGCLGAAMLLPKPGGKPAGAATLRMAPKPTIHESVAGAVLDKRSFCNTSAAESSLTPPAQLLNLSDFWQDACEKVQNPDARPRWPGQNLCWNRVKWEACMAYGGIVSWHDAQVQAASKGGAPYPELVRMQGLRNSDLCEHHHLGAPLPGIDTAELDATADWINANIAVYVLNLPKDIERFRSINASLTRLGIDFERIPGADFSVPHTYTAKKLVGAVPVGFNFTKAQATANDHFQGMGGIMGAMGCAAAHLGAMRHALAHAAPKPLALVLEDDVVLEPDFAPKLRRILEAEAPCDWNVISLKSTCPHGACISPHLLRVLPDSNEPAARCRHGVNWGFYAMLYRLGTLADLESRLARVVWDDDRPHCLDVDVALASMSDEVAYYAVPKIQAPGLFIEGAQASSRLINNAAETADLDEEERYLSHRLQTNTSTTTTITATTTTTTEAPPSWLFPWDSLR